MVMKKPLKLTMAEFYINCEETFWFSVAGNERGERAAAKLQLIHTHNI